MTNLHNTMAILVKEAYAEQNFLTLKNTIIEHFIEMDAEIFEDEGEYLWEDVIEELKSITNYSDMSELLVKFGYWDLSDVIRIAKLNKL